MILKILKFIALRLNSSSTRSVSNQKCLPKYTYANSLSLSKCFRIRNMFTSITSDEGRHAIKVPLNLSVSCFSFVFSLHDFL